MISNPHYGTASIQGESQAGLPKKRESNQVRLTKEAIRQAFLKQLDKKDPATIKVTDIVAEAGVSKATFYRYYKDVYELLADCFVEYLDVQQEIHEDAMYNDLAHLHQQGILLGLRKVRERPHLFLLCMQCQQVSFVADFYKATIAHSIEATKHFLSQLGITSEKCSISLQELAELCVDLSCAIVLRWVKAGCKEDVEEVARRSALCTERFALGMCRES